MTTDRDRDDVAALEEVGKTKLGYTIFREPNGVGGYRYWSDEIGGGVCAWDTCLVSPETLQECLRIEIAHAPAQEPVAVPAKKLYPAHPGALRASIAELDMWLDSSDALDEIKNQQSFSESIMLVVHELKRLQSVLAAAPAQEPVAVPALEKIPGLKPHEFLLLASYCGPDADGCSDRKPCPECLAMCNVFGEDGKYLRQLGAGTATEAAPVDGLLPIFADGGIGTRLSDAMSAYLADYVFGLEGGPDHEPTEFERAMLEDFLAGAISDETVNSILQEAARAMLAPAPVSPPADHSEDTLDMVGREKRARALSDLAAADGELLAAGVDRLPTPPAGEG